MSCLRCGRQATAGFGVEQVRLRRIGLQRDEGGRGALAVELRVMLWEKPDDKVTDLMRVMREGLFL